MTTLTQPEPPPPYRTSRAVRRGLAVAAGALALFLVGLGAFGLLDLASRNTIVERTSYPDVRSLEVSDASDLRLTSAPAGARLEVVARVTEGLRSPDRTLAQDADGTLRLSSSCSSLFTGQCGVRYDIRVPAGTSVRARTSAGDIDAEELRSTLPVMLRSLAGDITASDVTAPALDLSTSAGDIDAAGIRAPQVRVQSSAGDVRVELREAAGRLDAEASAGDIELIVPDEVYRLDAGANAGNVENSDLRTDPDSARVIRARTSAGDIRIIVRR